MIIFETIGNNVLYYIRDEEGSLIGFKYNDTMYHYIKNMQEDIIGLTDSNYNLLCSYVYDSWGKLISIKDNNGNIITDTSHIGFINPFRYRSYYYDNETKLYYLNSRYYNLEWGRFINADGILLVNSKNLNQNLYSYCGNNSINSLDKTGNGPISFLAKVAWKAVAKTLDVIGMKLSSTLLVHSLDKNPKDIYYDNSSVFTSAIKNDSAFNEVLKDLTSKGDAVYLDYKTSVVFSNTDLKGAINKAKLYVTGYVENGVGKYNVLVHDVYNFERSGYNLNSLRGLVFSIGNDMAWSDQYFGVINNYDIYINLDYTNYINGAVCSFD